MDASIRNHGWFCRRRTHVLGICQKDGQPSYINVWPDDVHSPFWPPTDRWAESKRDKYLAVLETMDQQLGGLFHYIKEDPYYRDNTLILICSDNGPEKGAGRAGPFRGFKTHLYEGGIRSSLIAWGSPLDNEKGARQQGERFFRHRSGSKLTGVYWSFH